MYPNSWEKSKTSSENVKLLNQTDSEEVLREVVKQPANAVRSLMANDVLPPVLDLKKVIDINRFTSLKRLLRVTDYVVRLSNALRAARQGKRPVKGKMETLTASVVKRAELMWIRSIQGASFSKEIAFLSLENAKATAPIYVQQFGLFLDDGHVLRCKGRLNNTSLNL